MSFDFAMSAEISKETVEAMIKAAVEAQSGQKVASVTMKVGEVGDDRFGSTRTEFTGATVKFETKRVAPMSNYR